MSKKLKIIILLGAMIASLVGCGGNEKQEENELNDVQSEEKKESDYRDSEYDNPESAKSDYDNVDSINIDSGDTKIAYNRSEKYTLESGEETLLVYFDFSNVSADETTIDSQYNFSAFQDGIEITIYSTIWDEFEVAQNRDKQILAGATLEIAVAIAPDNWDSPIELRVDDEMAYDEINTKHNYQKQELNLK